MRPFFTVVGVAALVAWTGSGIAAWVMTKDQITVVVHEGEEERVAEVDPLDLVQERVASLSEDLHAIVQVLEGNFSALDERAADRTTALGEELRRDLHADLDEVQARFARLDALLAAQAASLGELRDHARGSSAPTEESAADVGASATDAESSVAAAVEDPATPAAPAPVAVDPAPAEEVPAAKSSFLAFRLPSDDFRFDERRQWTIVPALSRVGFDGKSSLHDFTGKTSSVTGELEVDLTHPDLDPAGTIRVEAKALETGSDGRDEGMYEHLDVEHHPTIEFALEGIDEAKVDADARTVRAVARGTMTIRGVARAVTMPVRATVDDSRRLLLEGEMPLRLPDYSVPVPNKLGIVKVEEEVRVWIALRAKLVPRERP